MARKINLMGKGLLFMVFVMVCTACVQAAGGDFDFGPFASRHTTTNGHVRTRALGPFFERLVDDKGKEFVAFRPIVSRLTDPVRDEMRIEHIWPISTLRRQKNQCTWRYLTAYYTDFDTSDPSSRYRFWLFPFWFQGRDIEKRRYMALFPFGGRIREFVMLDKTDFFLFPLYSRTKQGSIRTHSVMWPLFSVSHGGTLSSVRILPFYSRSVKEGVWDNSSMLWPFWTRAQHEGKSTKGSGFIFFPFYGHITKGDKESWLFLPPLFRWTRGDDNTEANWPWPFVQYSRGDLEKRYLWPFFGRKEQNGIKKSFFMWPAVSSMERVRKREIARTEYVLPFLHDVHVVKRNEDGSEGEVTARRLKIWPAIDYERHGDVSRTRFPALWPALSADAIDRNYAPLWTLYLRDRRGESVEDELFWGLIRNRRSPDERYMSVFPLVSWGSNTKNGGEKEWALLKGLLGYRKSNGKGHLKLLWFEFGSDE